MLWSGGTRALSGRFQKLLLNSADAGPSAFASLLVAVTVSSVHVGLDLSKRITSQKKKTDYALFGCAEIRKSLALRSRYNRMKCLLM